MANPEHLELLGQGVDVWNEWRLKATPTWKNRPDLSEAWLVGKDLKGVDLSELNLRKTTILRTDLRGANLSGSNLRDAVLMKINLTGANLSETDLRGAILGGATLQDANLRGADLIEANFREADLCGADLTGADLRWATLVEAKLENAVLSGCRVYGVSAWNVTFNEHTKQQNLVITREGEPEVTTDDLEVAQFIYLMLHNEKLQRVIDTITSKVVLILGRFSPERKMVLDALRDELRTRNYVPVVFDFEKPTNRTTDETITFLARMARFVIADISDAKSVLQELRAIVPENPSVPVQSIIDAGQNEPGMFDFFKPYRWLLKVYRYRNPAQCLPISTSA